LKFSKLIILVRADIHGLKVGFSKCVHITLQKMDTESYIFFGYI